MPRSIDGKRGTSLGVLTAAVLLAGLLSPAASPAASDRTDADFAAAREAMVRQQIAARGVRDPEVLAALRATPRHRFVPPDLVSRAYDDTPLPIGHGQTISQPYIVALMTEALELTGREKVLEIGTGSGYQTAILSLLADQVFSIERFSSLALRARKILEALHYYHVAIRVGDGTYGWREESPFDAIIVTAGAPSIPKAYIDQLAVGGRLVIPVGDRYTQELIKVTKTSDKPDGLVRESLGGVRFVNLIGEHGWES